MFHLTRRRPIGAGIRFCDACGQVSTAAQRAVRLRERTRIRAWGWRLPC